jgi:hypothetical protein
MIEYWALGKSKMKWRGGRKKAEGKGERVFEDVLKVLLAVADRTIPLNPP